MFVSLFSFPPSPLSQVSTCLFSLCFACRRRNIFKATSETLLMSHTNSNLANSQDWDANILNFKYDALWFLLSQWLQGFELVLCYVHVGVWMVNQDTCALQTVLVKMLEMHDWAANKENSSLKSRIPVPSFHFISWYSISHVPQCVFFRVESNYL